ncbi:hypothetical protein NDU88_003504 [Pleurodeles waltl]|uniref:Uncharacterized protein n=1 Tax=Pleurodeles waltl TaxID=8319 RepID=A0AAV7Q948_PLEWA|nr:hypothetical protein NDU88_003504 [Pleurodeles waltl]
MMSPWDLVSPQARDSIDPGPFPGSRPSFLPFRCPLGCRLQDPQGPCLQSLPRSRSRSRGGVMSGVSPSALLRQPRSASSGRGPYAVHPAISAVGRISPRRGPALQSAPPTSGSRHSRAPDF